MQRLSILLLSLLFLMPIEARAQSQDRKEDRAAKNKVFQVENIALLNAISEFGKRAPSTKIMADFIKAVEAAVEPLAKKAFADDRTPHNGLVAVAIRPDGTRKFWVDVGDEFRTELTSDLEKAMVNVGTPRVINGPVAFSLNFQIWSGVEKPKVKKMPAGKGVAPPNLPVEWLKVAKEIGKELHVTDELLPLVWPVEAANAEDEKRFVPEGFVLQSLDPLGGSILRPRDWHFNQGNSHQSVTWTISKTPPEGGYITGVKIQLVYGVKKSIGQTPEELIKSFIDSKRQFKILSEREATQQGGFTRIGLETEEPQAGKKDAEPFRILYSCFWNNELDMAAITTSGTTKDLWEEHRETFDVMAGLTLIDIKKAKSKQQDAKK